MRIDQEKVDINNTKTVKNAVGEIIEILGKDDYRWKAFTYDQQKFQNYRYKQLFGIVMDKAKKIQEHHE